MSCHSVVEDVLKKLFKTGDVFRSSMRNNVRHASNLASSYHCDAYVFRARHLVTHGKLNIVLTYLKKTIHGFK